MWGGSGEVGRVGWGRVRCYILGSDEVRWGRTWGDVRWGGIDFLESVGSLERATL